jgi:hypothetical protein
MMPKWISTIGDVWELILPALWLVISAAVALLSVSFARRNLTRHFRYQATLSYQPPKPREMPKMKPGQLPAAHRCKRDGSLGKIQNHK